MAPDTQTQSALHRTYRYRLYPTRRQAEALQGQLREACDLYNAALEHRKWMWRSYGQSVSFYDQDAELKYLRAEGILDGGASFASQRAILRRLDRAFAAFFRRVKAGEKPGFPRFRASSRFETLTFVLGAGAALTDAGRLRLQNVGHIKVKQHRPIPAGATPCEARITRHNGKWYVAISLKDVPTKPLSLAGRAVGVDLGISTFAATSDGELISGPRAERAAAQAVRRAARKVSRRRRGSRRRRKAAVLLARQREHERNRRRDHAFKTAADLVEHYDMICIEKLNHRGLARGMLARDVHDQGWAQFIACLSDKAEEAGRKVVLVDAKNTSQECSACGLIVSKALATRMHSCDCGYVADRDVNAARNILTRGTGPDGAVRRQRWGEEARAVA